MRQIALPLRAGHGSGDAEGEGDGPVRVVLGNANRPVIAAFDQAATWPFGTAILFGPPRSGKTGLARWFAQCFGVAVDDADTMDETALFHRWNAAHAAGRPLLLTARADTPGAGWQVALPDLASRLAAALRLDIGAPDDAMLAALIVAHGEARGMPIAPDGAAYLASRCERSHVGAEMLIATIDRLSLEAKAPPGPAIWREALAELHFGPDVSRQGRLL